LFDFCQVLLDHWTLVLATGVLRSLPYRCKLNTMMVQCELHFVLRVHCNNSCWLCFFCC